MQSSQRRGFMCLPQRHTSVLSVTVYGRPRQNEAGALPERFEEALLSLRDAPRPRGLLMEEIPAPRKLAPYSAALTAETVETAGTTPIATGRFVVLYNPNGEESWGGDFRIVIQAHARIDDEVGMDPVFESAAWSWLTDGLEDSRAGYRALTALRRGLAWSQRTAWPQVDDTDDVLTVTYEDIVVATNLSGQQRPAPELTAVLLSWDPIDSGTPCLSPGQTLVARR